MGVEAGGGRSRGPRDIQGELAAEDLRALDGLAFRVYGPADDPLPDALALLSWHRVNGQLVEVELAHGAWSTAEGPYVSVQTLTRAAAADQGGSHHLREVVEDERDRLFDQAGIDEGEAPDLVVESEIWITVEGTPVRAELRSEGRLWAARLHLGGLDCPLDGAGGSAGSAGAAESGGSAGSGGLGGSGGSAGSGELGGPGGMGGSTGEPVTVTITGRGLAPEQVALRAVGQLEPYARGRQRKLAEFRDRRGNQPHIRDRELPPVRGLEAHRELIERSVRDGLRLEADLRAGRLPRRPRSEPRDEGELWERTVRQQMRLAGEDHQEADEAVTALVNQMVGLSERADWFPDTPAAETAVEESIRYTVFDSQVSSIEAQLAWQAHWSARMTDAGSLTEDPTIARERLHRHVAVRSGWLELWQRWYEGLAD
jgi:hypothetical protein